MPPTRTSTPPAEALTLSESISLTEGLSNGSIFDEDGNVPLHILRPCVGKGRGAHLYEAEMLAENADKFTGWKMYIDHESPEARKAAGGLPRKTRDLGGRIVEASWDPNVPADPERGYGQGAIVGKAKPTPFIRELVENDPEILEASISAQATSVRPVVRAGKRVNLVEGIEDRGSVDWVTEAGAGGRVAALLEAYAREDSSQEVALLESFDDDELLAYLEENRPNLSVAEGAMTKCIHGHKMSMDAKKCPECGAKALAEADTHNPEGGDDMADITPEALTEALTASPEVLTTALAQSAEAQLFMSTLVEAKLEEERESIQAEAKAEADRVHVLYRLRDEAKGLIEASRLPESWRADLAAKFEIVEGKATPALDVVDDVDDEGTVTKAAADKLREAVEAEITRERERLAEVQPTRVREQGTKPAELREGEKTDPENKTDPEAPSKADTSYWGQVLQEAGVNPDRAYAA